MATRQSTSTHFFRYEEILGEIQQDLLANPRTMNSYSAYTQANIVTQASWLPQRRLCREICVSTVAISLHQDEHKLVNTQDGYDLADLRVMHYKNNNAHLQYHANTFHPNMMPCLLPGTIITLGNHLKILRYFWKAIRPNITVPYTLLTVGSDADSPLVGGEFIGKDPLLQSWYGTNPLYSKPGPKPFPKTTTVPNHTFQPMPLGFSKQHPQERHLMPYMKINNFNNPFTHNLTSTWKNLVFDGPKANFDFDQHVFVHFGLRREHRKALWKILCPNSTTTTTTTTTTASDTATNTEARQTSSSSSCHQNTNTLPVEQIYADMSKYIFGVSPPGAGWDCYRTYELLLMGVIPIIEERIPESYELFQDLPVIHMANLTKATSRQDFVRAIQDYVTSAEFANKSFEQGWKRLFLKYQRRQILQSTGRDEEILTDEQGREYYQAYRYEYFPARNEEPVVCSVHENCQTPDGPIDSSSWLSKPPELSKSEIDFLEQWKRKGL